MCLQVCQTGINGVAHITLEWHLLLQYLCQWIARIRIPTLLGSNCQKGQYTAVRQLSNNGIQPMSHRLVTFKHQAKIVTLSVYSREDVYEEFPMVKTSSDITLNTLARSLTIRQPDTASCHFTPYPYSAAVLRLVYKAHCTAAIADTYCWQILSVNNCSPQGWIQIQNLTDSFWPKFAIVISAIKTNKNRKKSVKMLSQMGEIYILSSTCSLSDKYMYATLTNNSSRGFNSKTAICNVWCFVFFYNILV